MKISNNLLTAADKSLVSILVLLHLSVAFNTIDHTIMLHRLEHLVGIKCIALNWFKSYFSDQFKIVNVNDKSSKYYNGRDV